jgi:catechol 2,3-dioxygenase-like lactoylglutathione lyase family enzyme
MTISLQFFNITVNDTDEAVAFYRDALGFEVRNDVENGGFHWITMGEGGDGKAQIVLSEPHAGRSKADGDSLQELVTKGAFQIVFSSDDVDAAFEKARSTGAEVLQEPIEQFWGVKDCALRDPSGNMVRISQSS